MTRTSTLTARFAPTLAALALLLAACSSAASLPQDVGEDANEHAGEQPAASAASGEEGSGEQQFDRDGSRPALAAPIERSIIKTGEITLEVANVGEALGRVRALAVELGGYVGGSQAGTLDERATLTLRVPAAGFETAIARLHEMDAEVVAESTREDDVSGQVVDLGARIANLEASEASYRQLVERAEEIEDILAVQARLDDVREEIEQLTAQLESLEGQAALSTLTVTLVPVATPVQTTTEAWNPGTQLEQAVAALVGTGQGLVDGVIWIGIVWLPMLLGLAAIALVGWRVVLEVRRRMPGERAAGDEGAA
jgi:hypothetical protein